MDANEMPYMVATTFALNYKGSTYLVTNNHVCASLSGDGTAYIKTVNGPSVLYDRDYDVITEVSVTKQSDVCIMKTVNPHLGLNLSMYPTYLQQPVTVFGFLGRSDFGMVTIGKMYGSDSMIDYAGFVSCKEKPPRRLSIENFICLSKDKYPITSLSPVLMATVNIGPGFSGSPVLNSYGEVVGIVSRYMPPSKIYGNGDGIYYPSSYIMQAIDNAKFVDVTSEEFDRDMTIWKKYQDMTDAYYKVMSFINRYILEVRN
jgi:hypothetical protein